MIVEKEVQMNLTNTNRKYYTDKGYNTTAQKNISVKIEDLPVGSHVCITAKCKKCQIENTLMYYKYLKNYNKYAYYTCKKCSRDKAKKTNMSRYGAESYLQTEVGKNRIHATCIEKYGVANPLNNKSIQDKKQTTIRERYGNNCALMNDTVRKKSENTMLQKYGAKRFNQSIFFKHKIHKNWAKFYPEKLKEYGIHNFTIKEGNVLSINCKCCNNFYDTTYKMLYQRTKLYNVEPCTICNPINKQISWAEQEIFNFVSEHTQTIQTDKSVLGGKHIDILCSDKKFGIEYNGVFWHSEKYTQPNEHFEKYRNAKKQGVKLFSIYEDQWINKKMSIKKLLSNYINKTYETITDYKIKSVENFTHDPLFKGYIEQNIFEMYTNDKTIGHISFNYKTFIISHFDFDVDFNPNDVLKLFIKDLDLTNYTLYLDNNNVFIDTSEFNFIRYNKPNYTYLDINNKKNIVLLEKKTIESMYIDEISIMNAGYFKVFDNGYSFYHLSKFKEIEDFLKQNNIEYKDGDDLSFKMPNGRNFEIQYIYTHQHTDKHVSKDYFYKLSREAEDNNRFIFWVKDFEWNDVVKREVLKSYILHAAGKTPNRIYARDCNVVILNSKTCRQFETENCFYGKRGASLNLGLILKRDIGKFKMGQLVMIYTFGKNFFAKKEDIVEVIRVGTLKYTHVVGGSSKLFKHFVNNYKTLNVGNRNMLVKNIKFYSDYDHNIGGSLEEIGFIFEKYSSGGIMNYWIDKGIVKHRQPTKHALIIKMINEGKCLTIPNAGVKCYIYKSKEIQE